MTDKPVHRRLAAILAADVVGYSRLMGQDEAGTLATVQKLRTDVIEPHITANEGSLFQSMGDGFLAEFPSVVNAVACAAATQQAMANRNAGLPEGQTVELRIGAHLGDVIVEGGRRLRRGGEHRRTDRGARLSRRTGHFWDGS